MNNEELKEIDWPESAGVTYLNAMVFSDGNNVFLLYPCKNDTATMCLSFVHPWSVKYGSPNDEVIDAHPFEQIGLELGAAYIVLHSRWKSELEAVNATHDQYDSKHWNELKHFVFMFKDYMFECVALKFNCEVIACTLTEAMKQKVEK